MDLAHALSRLLNDADFHKRRRASGLATARQLNWDTSNALVEQFIHDSVMKKVRRATAEHHPPTPMVTVVIPVHNGGDMLRAVVEACLDQDIDVGFEVLLIDSASSDGCLKRSPDIYPFTAPQGRLRPAPHAQSWGGAGGETCFLTGRHSGEWHVR